MTWDQSPRSPPPAPPQGNTPPLFAAFQWALQQGWRGRIGYEAEDGSRGVIQVTDGRVTGLECAALSSTHLLDLFRRAGILDPRNIDRLERHTRRTGADPVAAAVETGLVSKATLSAIREATAREILLGLLLERGLRTHQVPDDLTGGGPRDFGFPLPFLLKEAHRRHQEAPAIRQVVTGADQVFVRCGAGNDTTLHRWEDLTVSPAERQVFFFVDGRRSVSDLALATCQSLHEVSRALASLHAGGLVRSMTPGEVAKQRKRDPAKQAGRASLLRLGMMVFALALAVASLRQAAMLAPPAPEGAQEFHRLLRQGSALRVQAAGCLFRLREGRAPADFEELLEHRLVLSGDRKTAVMRDLLQETP